MDHSQHTNMHSSVSHEGMDHTMPGMDEDRCSMNMLFTWDWKNSCIVFKWWHVKTPIGFVITLIAITLLGSFYELFKSWFSRWEQNELATISASNSPTLSQERKFKVKRGLFYGFQVLYSFWLMLVFMTYNGWYMLAVAIGAGLGNFIWGNSSKYESGSVRNMSCH